MQIKKVQLKKDFKEVQQDRRMRRDKITQYNIPNYIVPKIKSGADFTLEDGTVIPHLELTRSAQKARSFAFCSDTAFKPDIVPLLKDCDLLYHEATFLEDKKALTERTKHATAIEAATIAKMANVTQLILGHYSSRYENTNLFKEEANTVFDNVALAATGKVFEIKG